MENTRTFFTDGSKIENKTFVGFAVLDCSKNVVCSFRSYKITSIFTAEAMAILEALKIVEGALERNFSIFTDSKSVVEAVNGMPKLGSSSYIIFKIKDKLRYLVTKGKKVKLFWIPAHKGIIFNEMVDIEAKASCDSGRDTVECIPNSDWRTFWKELCMKEARVWYSENEGGKGKKYFEMFYRYEKKLWFTELSLSRKAITSINRIRSGHTYVKQSLKIFNIVSTDLCECGEGVESVNHIFWQCVRYEMAREEMIKDLKKAGQFPPYNIVPLLCSMKPSCLAALGRFINLAEISI
ncbi:hypothetical protein KPH14_012834 [Odynerus spinipes]|uniref:RNase H type-1 domain-containing protein n=1 Tax=Odynerus spinipes TaxID=1348599 RepID=A0AAD9RFH5_9HYME|nr:hypothetical protein KPH14_012834 [Odynerus spinipes]